MVLASTTDCALLFVRDDPMVTAMQLGSKYSEIIRGVEVQRSEWPTVSIYSMPCAGACFSSFRKLPCAWDVVFLLAHNCRVYS